MVFYKNNANPKAYWPKQRQLQIPETARTAGGCDCPGAQKRQGFLLLLVVASYISLVSAQRGENSLIPLLRLSPAKPLRWVSPGPHLLRPETLPEIGPNPP